MINKSKCDPELGKRVHEHLKSLGIETPMTDLVSSQTTEEKIVGIEHHFEKIMEILGLDLTDDSLMDTPTRVGKMYVKEIMYGLDYDNFPKCTTVVNKMNAEKSFVLERNITTHSLCEHHFLSINGRTSIAYIPKDKVLGLSKLNRLLDFFARRPQIQERLTQQVCEAVAFITGSDDVAVYTDAKHLCVSTRGIRDNASSTVTLATKGIFETDNQIRSEFLAISRQGRV